MVFTCRVHSNTRDEQCRGCLYMERSHDPVQIELRNRVERREKMKKFKFYVACLILCPIATTCFVYVYLKLHSIQMSFVWVLIFLAIMLTLPFALAIVTYVIRELKFKIRGIRKRIRFQIQQKKITQDYDTFCKIILDHDLSEDIVRHILRFLPRVVSGRCCRNKTFRDRRVFLKRTVHSVYPRIELSLTQTLRIITHSNTNNYHSLKHYTARYIAIDTAADLAIVTESGKSRLRLMRADLSESYHDKYLRIREVRNIPFVPEGIAVSSSSYRSTMFVRTVQIYVTDIASHRVAMFDVEGQCLWCVGRLGSMPGRFDRPGGCSISRGCLYVCDTGNHRLQVLSCLSGRFLRSIGSEGHGKGRLLEPTDCEVHNNRVFVVDALNFRIQVFCAIQGCVLFTWGSRSSSVAGFWASRCILIHRGYIYITEHDGHQSLCKVFEEHTQTHVKTWLLSNCVADPIGIAANHDRIYIVDHRGAVRIFF